MTAEPMDIETIEKRVERLERVVALLKEQVTDLMAENKLAEFRLQKMVELLEGSQNILDKMSDKLANFVQKQAPVKKPKRAFLYPLEKPVYLGATSRE